MRFNHSRRRIASMQALDQVLVGIQSKHADPRLLTARRTLAAVVGNQNAKDCRVLSVRGPSILVGIRTAEVQKRIEGLSNYILRMIGEQNPGEPIREINFVIRPKLNATMTPLSLPSRLPKVAVTVETEDLIHDITGGMLDDDLRVHTVKWMSRVWAEKKG